MLPFYNSSVNTRIKSELFVIVIKSKFIFILYTLDIPPGISLGFKTFPVFSIHLTMCVIEYRPSLMKRHASFIVPEPGWFSRLLYFLVLQLRRQEFPPYLPVSLSFFPQSPFFPQSELERLNNIPEARMKRSLSTVSVYQRECLKLSSRCLHFSTRGMFQQGRFVIQMGGMRRNYEGKKKKISQCFLDVL